MIVAELFADFKTKNIICWGSGKHFKNLTLPFLKSSGLIENLQGFVENSGETSTFAGITYENISVKELRRPQCKWDVQSTVILISAVGYKEILSQIHADSELKKYDAIPAIFLEALYEDVQMLAAPKPPLGFRKNAEQKIPKIIHTFWFSDKPGIPEKYLKYIDSWKKYAPDCEIKIWTLDTYRPMAKCLFFEQAIEAKMWAFATDYARADVLRRYGGIYMDMDVEMLKPIEDLFFNDAYMSFESLDRIECGSGMGAKAGHPIIEEICKDYESRPFVKEDGSLDLSTCPVRFTKVIEKHGLVKNGGFQFVEDITVYPFEVLTGKSFDTGIIYQRELSYTLHHHKGSWVPGAAKDAMENRYAEINMFLKERGIQV